MSQEETKTTMKTLLEQCNPQGTKKKIDEFLLFLFLATAGNRTRSSHLRRMQDFLLLADLDGDIQVEETRRIWKRRITSDCYSRIRNVLLGNETQELNPFVSVSKVGERPKFDPTFIDLTQEGVDLLRNLAMSSRATRLIAQIMSLFPQDRTRYPMLKTSLICVGGFSLWSLGYFILLVLNSATNVPLVVVDLLSCGFFFVVGFFCLFILPREGHANAVGWEAYWLNTGRREPTFWLERLSRFLGVNPLLLTFWAGWGFSFVSRTIIGIVYVSYDLYASYGIGKQYIDSINQGIPWLWFIHEILFAVLLSTLIWLWLTGRTTFQRITMREEKLKEITFLVRESKEIFLFRQTVGTVLFVGVVFLANFSPFGSFFGPGVSWIDPSLWVLHLTIGFLFPILFGLFIGEIIGSFIIYCIILASMILKGFVHSFQYQFLLVGMTCGFLFLGLLLIDWFTGILPFPQFPLEIIWFVVAMLGIASIMLAVAEISRRQKEEDQEVLDFDVSPRET